MDKDIAIYSFKVAQGLIRGGYKLLNMELNSRVKGKIVFYFENDEITIKELSDKYGIEIK